MTSIPIESAEESYKGVTEEETIRNIVEAGGFQRIYKYANDFGDKITHTDYKCILYPGDPQEGALFRSPYVHNVVLVYDDGTIMNLDQEPPEAAKNGDVQEVQGLLAEKADVNARDKHGRTPLHAAATYGYTEIVELLLERGADVNARDEDGWVPLRVAAYRGSYEVAELLLARGADVNARGKVGWTPLGFAVEKGRTEVAALLRRHGGVE